MCVYCPQKRGQIDTPLAACALLVCVCANMSEYEQWRTGDDVDDALWVGRQNDEQVHGMKIMLITDWDSVSALRVQESLSPYPLALSL